MCEGAEDWGMDDAADRMPVFVNLSMNGQFVGYLILLQLVRSLPVKVHPLYGGGGCVAHPSSSELRHRIHISSASGERALT